MHHIFDVDIAVKYGVNAAILLQNIAFWCEHSRANEKHFYDGMYWTYNSVKAFQIQFPYMGKNQINNALKKLTDEGLVIKGNYNKNTYDRTCWYALTDFGKCIVTKSDNAFPLSENQTFHFLKSEMDFSKPEMDLDESRNGFTRNQKPIPDIIPNINTDTFTHSADGEDEGGEVDHFNPYGEGERPSKDTVFAYASSNLVSLSRRAMEEIVSFAEDLSEDVVRHAIDNALDNGVRTWAYVKSILNRYMDDGVKNLADAKAADDKRKKEQASAAAPKEKTWDEMTEAEQNRALNSGPFGRFY